MLFARSAYEFAAQTTLASNRPGTNVTVTLPNAAVSNLVQNSLLSPEKFEMAVYMTNLAAFNSNFPTGNYVFNVTANGSTQPNTVTMPADAQPNAPQITDFTAAQSVNPSQPFTLTWNTFTNGGSTDWVFLSIPLGNTQAFQSPIYGQSNTLTGTASSFTIPAGTLQPNTNYNASLLFGHVVPTTNGVIINVAGIGSVTGFTISTRAGTPAPH